MSTGKYGENLLRKEGGQKTEIEPKISRTRNLVAHTHPHPLSKPVIRCKQLYQDRCQIVSLSRQ